MVTGGSKRGWTAWLTAAVDSRVVAVAPVVIDLLNMKRSFAHHWASYGFWAEALKPYQDSHIFDRFDEPRATHLLQIVDPFAYLDRLTIPKYIINAAGDDFFVMDSLQFYIDDLLGETHVRVMPNANHYLDDGKLAEALEGAIPYYYDILNDIPRPQYSWTLPGDGSIRVETIDTPKAVRLWQAHNPDTRDFRLTTIGPTWTSSPLAEQSPGVYIASVPTPPHGWTAFFVELTYSHNLPMGGDDYDYHFTSEIHVLPQQRPFETDFSRDRITDLDDLTMLSDAWLTDNPYRDITPRRSGDGIINIKEMAIFAQNWLKGQ
jgi:PhoPQ-activated pathogenicity-related protein